MIVLKALGWGDIPDWVSAIAGVVSALGSLAALWFVIIQVTKGNKLERAMNIENSRPRFTLTFSKRSDGFPILFQNESATDGNSLKKGEVLAYDIMQVKNISDNLTYENRFALEFYENNETKPQYQFLSYDGLGREDNAVLIFPVLSDMRNITLNRLILKFITNKNETGYAIWQAKKDTTSGNIRNFDDPKYYYIISENSDVRAYGENSEMVKERATKSKKIEKVMGFSSERTYFFTHK